MPNGDLYLFIGTSIVSNKHEFTPQSGNLYLMHLKVITDLDNPEDHEYMVHSKDSIRINGAVIDISIWDQRSDDKSFIVMAVNSTVEIYELNTGAGAMIID